MNSCGSSTEAESLVSESSTSSSSSSPQCETTDFSRVPKMAIINGLFLGSIPIELSEITNIEESMVAIYSAISKVSLHGGKHYHTTPSRPTELINTIFILVF
jgi:hypothetical protein